MVDVNAAALKGSSDRLHERAQAAEKVGEPRVAGLLYFYSAECRLKALILRRRNWSDTSAMDKKLRTHQLRELAKELRYPAPPPTDPLRCRRSGKDAWFETHELHEAWRYGAVLDSKDEGQAIEALKSLYQAAKKEY